MYYVIQIYNATGNMAPPLAFDQDSVFYDDQWTREVDNVFIKGLVEQTIVGNPIVGGMPNRRAMLYCRDRVNGEFFKDFSYRTCVERFRRLYDRYLLFTSIVERLGVTYNIRTFKVDASDDVWEYLCEVSILYYLFFIFDIYFI